MVVEGSERDARADLNLWEDLVAAVSRRKAIILVVFVAMLVGTYGALCFVSNQYEAEARLLVRLGRENAEVPLTVDKGGVYTTGVQKEEINSYIELLTSRALVEAAVANVGIDRFRFEAPPPTTTFEKIKDRARTVVRAAKRGVHDALVWLAVKQELDDREKANKLVTTSLAARRLRDSNVIHVSLRLPDPNVARDTLQALLEVYNQRHVDLQRVAGVRTVFDERRELYRAERERLQATLAEIREQFGLSSVSEQQSLLLERMHAMKRRIDEAEGERTRLESERAQLAARLAELPLDYQSSQSIGPNPRVRSIKDKLVEVQLRRLEAVSRYREDSVLVQTIDQEIDELVGLLGDEEDTEPQQVVNQAHPLRMEFEREIERVGVSLAGIVAAVGEDQRNVAELEVELARIYAGEDLRRAAELELSMAERNYVAYAERGEQSRINEGLARERVANVVVLSTPTFGPEPVSPRRLLFLQIAAAGGLLLGMGLALLLHWRDGTSQLVASLSEDDVLPYLGEFRLDRTKSDTVRPSPRREQESSP